MNFSAYPRTNNSPTKISIVEHVIWITWKGRSKQGLFWICSSINNYNNNWFLYSAFPIKIKSASQCIIYYPGHTCRIQNKFCTHSALSPLPGEHSGKSPFYKHIHANSTTIPFASYRDPIYTPGSRSAMWIKCLAEGQKYRMTVGNRTWAFSVRVE